MVGVIVDVEEATGAEPEEPTTMLEDVPSEAIVPWSPEMEEPPADGGEEAGTDGTPGI